MNILNRMQSPTPKFFQKIRNIGFLLAAISGTIIATPVALPVLVVKLAGYLAVADTVATTVSEAVTPEDETKCDQ